MITVTVEVVLHRNVEEKADVAVGNLVEDLPTLLARPDQAGETKLAQLVTGGRLAGPNDPGEVAHAQLAPFHQGIDDAETPGVGEQAKSLGQQIGGILIEQALRHRTVPVLP
jgi:hypothetical protein